MGCGPHPGPLIRIRHRRHLVSAWLVQDWDHCVPSDVEWIVSGTEAAAENRLYQVVFDLPDEIAAWLRGGIGTVVGGEDRHSARGRSPEHALLLQSGFLSRPGSRPHRPRPTGTGVRRVRSLHCPYHRCTWEIDAGGRLWAIDVPPSVNYDAVLAELVKLLEAERIEIEEAALSVAHGRPLQGAIEGTG